MSSFRSLNKNNKHICVDFVCITELTDFTAFARASPGRPQSRTALRLQRGPVYIHLTAAVLNVQPAGSFHAVCMEKMHKNPENNF